MVKVYSLPRYQTYRRSSSPPRLPIVDSDLGWKASSRNLILTFLIPKQCYSLVALIYMVTGYHDRFWPLATDNTLRSASPKSVAVQHKPEPCAGDPGHSGWE